MKKSLAISLIAVAFAFTGCQTFNAKVIKSAKSVNTESINRYASLNDAYKAYNLFTGVDADGHRYYSDSFQFRGHRSDVQLFTNYDSYRVPVKIAYHFCKYRENGTLERFELPSIQSFRNTTPYTERGFYVCNTDNGIQWGVKVEIDRPRSNAEFVYMVQTVMNAQSVKFIIDRDISVTNKAISRTYNDPALERLDYETYGK